MFRERTVFVVGAGAGVPYGFPVGDELRRQIVALIRTQRNANPKPKKNFVGHAMTIAQVDLDTMSAMATDLERAAPESIDALLESRPEYLDAGKLAIALALLPREADSKMFAPDGGDWIGHLAQRIFAGGVGPSLASFVTFNYDRLLEHRLTLHVAAKLGVSLEEAWQKVGQSVEIIHIHGQLGEYSPRHEPGKVPWGGAINVSQQPEASKLVYTAASGISLVNERHDETPSLRLAQGLIGNAKRVFFLGFGFDPSNVRRLSATLRDHISLGSPLYTSAYDLRAGEKVVVRRLLSEHFLGGSGPIDKKRHTFVEGDCLDLLRAQAHLLS